MADYPLDGCTSPGCSQMSACDDCCARAGWFDEPPDPAYLARVAERSAIVGPVPGFAQLPNAFDRARARADLLVLLAASAAEGLPKRDDLP